MRFLGPETIPKVRKVKIEGSLRLEGVGFVDGGRIAASYSYYKTCRTSAPGHFTGAVRGRRPGKKTKDT